MRAAILEHPHTREFCKGISRETPFYVMVKPMPGLEVGNCFKNLDVVIAKHGGSAVIGWVIHEWPGVFIEAEYHYTWKKSDGTYEDPTPRSDRRKRLPFLPDSKLNSSSLPNNIRKCLSDDPDILVCLEAIDRLKQMPSLEAAKEAMRLKRSIEQKFGHEPE